MVESKTFSLRISTEDNWKEVENKILEMQKNIAEYLKDDIKQVEMEIKKFRPIEIETKELPEEIILVLENGSRPGPSFNYSTSSWIRTDGIVEVINEEKIYDYPTRDDILTTVKITNASWVVNFDYHNEDFGERNQKEERIVLIYRNDESLFSSFKNTMIICDENIDNYITELQEIAITEKLTDKKIQNILEKGWSKTFSALEITAIKYHLVILNLPYKMFKKFQELEAFYFTED